MATYTSVRRSSTSSAGSDTAAAGSGVAAASRDDTNTKETTGASSFAAAMSVSASSSSRPSISPITATPSPLNFLSLAETSFTPLSMDSDLFPDRDFSGSISSTANWKSDSPSPGKLRSTTLQLTSGKGAPSNATTTTESGMSLSDDGAELTMRAPHAPASASSAADAVAALAMSPEKEEHVSGARELDVTMQSARQPGQGRRQEQEQGQEMARNVGLGRGTAAAAEGEKQGEGEGETELDDQQEAISRMNPRQRYAGSTPLSLDPLQVARGSSAATDTSTAATTNTNSSSSSSPSAASQFSPKSKSHLQSQQAQPQSPPRSLRQSNSSISSPPVQHIAPLALRTKNIGDNNNININTTAPNTSSITSPLSAASAASALSAPAAFTRQISTSSLRSNSSLISQIQDSLQQQQHQQQHQSPSRYHHHHSSSSGSNIVQPVPKPIVRTTSDSNTFILKHPVPDLNCRSGAYVGNVAALEKTAERLSMTSSIEDAIRDLHGELKRSDSRRSSILAASVAASQSPIDDAAAQPGPLRVIPPVASIVELNNAARHGGYSPSGYVMSPNHSLTGRLRSGSKNSASGRPEIDVDAVMSRHGPGKGSTRSARSGMSGKPSLAEIAESEPVALTQRALDDADRAPLADDDATIRRPNTHYEENGDSTSYNVGGHLDQEQSGLGLDFGRDNGRPSEDRPATPRSTATFDHKNAFDDFDGVHCQPDQYSERGGWDSREQSDGEYNDMPPPQPKTMPMPDITEPPFEPQPRPMPRPPKATQVRPQSYFDELTGQEMLYYPARVPAMLNLPPKLSRKPKTNVRNARHSKVLQAMGHPGFGKAEYLPQHPEAPAVRESKMWLPDPLAGHGATTLGEDIDGQRSGGTSIKESTAGVDSHVPAEQRDGLLAGEPEDMPMAPPPTQRRKSKMPRAADLPPQLRASAFFDLPSTTPQIEMKDGSAMATLDSILDASANAPVSAFTDHAFAGKLGSEVYGPDGKKNRRKSAAPGALLPEEHIAASQKKKKGILPFGKKSADTSRANSMAQDDEGKALSDNVDAESKKSGEESEEEEEDEFAHVLDGPPTTLLAELQLRKYNQKLRTQMPNSALAGGMHSTLLELDAVAEAQKRHREKKKIALAWEDGANDEKEDSDDDEVPLGVLYANQGVVADVNRPLGLMEQREREENEPLSSRRARLTGQPEPPRSLKPQRSAMTLNAGLSQLRLNHMPSSERVRPQEESEDDEPGETLGERMRRLRAKDEADHNNLPKARPVSRAFSAEILTQFGEPEEKKDEDKGKEKEVPPEEETLGQRRKRLQAEREAREREMTLGGGLGGGLGINQPEAPPLRKQHSLADVLGSHPGIHHENPALKEQARLQEEERKVRAAEAKMAAVRAQMPTSLDKPKALAPTGGYMNGKFNDGNGGTAGSRRVSGLIDNVQSSNAGAGVNMAPGWNRSSMAFSSYGAPLQMPQQQQQPAYGGLIGQAGMTQMANKPAIASGYGSYTAGGMGGAGAMGGMNNMNGMGMNMNNMQMNPYGGGMGMPMQTQPMAMNMGMQQQQMTPMQMQQMQMQMQPGQPQSIERWRQSIMY